jgi:PAS domain-containing protein
MRGEDPRCQEALTMFCAVLGMAAGNLVVTLGARGGLFIGGGIVFFILVALGVALLFWRRIVSSIIALSQAAKAIGEGATPQIEASPIHELDEVRKEIETAAGERKKAADRLQYEVLLVQKITESVAESIFITDSDGHVTFVNAKALETFGFSAEELLGYSLHEKIHDRHPDGTPFPRGECVLARSYHGQDDNRCEDVFFRKRHSRDRRITMPSEPTAAISTLIARHHRAQAIAGSREAGNRPGAVACTK